MSRISCKLRQTRAAESLPVRVGLVTFSSGTAKGANSTPGSLSGHLRKRYWLRPAPPTVACLTQRVCRWQVHWSARRKGKCMLWLFHEPGRVWSEAANTLQGPGEADPSSCPNLTTSQMSSNSNEAPKSPESCALDTLASSSRRLTGVPQVEALRNWSYGSGLGAARSVLFVPLDTLLLPVRYGRQPGSSRRHTLPSVHLNFSTKQQEVSSRPELVLHER